MRRLGILFFICFLTSVTFAENTQKIQQEKKQFINKLVKKDHFQLAKLDELLLPIKPNQKLIQAMNKPFEKKPWIFYRDFFITPERIILGAQYLKKHHRVLMVMQKKYGIPASIITAIIGVETEYGMHLGKYSVLNALYTLGFYYPPREKFFRKELAQYLILTRDNHLNPKTIKGSYAGALGIPQFMPSSYRHYSVSYDNNKFVNLFHNNDAIASVAYYFHQNGWKPNQPITHLTNQAHGKNIIALSLGKSMQYWKIDPNFHVIMSYNHNVVYAMVVYQLSRAIEKQYALDLSRKTKSHHLAPQRSA